MGALSSINNDRFATQIIAHLVKQGVRRVCLSPGSRSSPLSAAAAREPLLEKLVHFDERSMAFHAYGYAKGSKTPVAVITTSGSATGNLLPAIMEASYDHVPLIILTADRPHELRDCQANQTCDQVKMFGNFVRWYAEIPAAEPELSDEWLGTTIAQAVFRSMLPPHGPVHLNCQFREPFFSGDLSPISTSTHYEPCHTVIASTTLQAWADRLSSLKKGVIVAGSMPSSAENASIFQLAEKLDWPVIPDLMSGLRSQTSHKSSIPYFVDLLKSASNLDPDCILHLGDRLISKPLQTWIAGRKPSTYLMVANHPLRSDPSHRITHRVMTDPSLFCEQLLPFLSPQSSWLDEWKCASTAIEEHVNRVVEPFSEPGLIRYLHHHLPPHYAIYFSNSMPIRDADRLFFPPLQQGPIFGQRGLSGIDGNIGVAIGLAEGAGLPLVAVLGDLAALHDLNSLAQLRSSKVPVIFIVINNGGGGIFSFLPLSNQKDIFEEYIAGSHNWNFAKAAEMFQVPYAPLTNFERLRSALLEEKTMLFEFTSDRKQNVAIHNAMELKEALQWQHS
jgi:2-succinyl-5-enolpyruvyl-6-hydroxy-3-cyclohexene-1-carboxylate synthase